MARSFFKHYTHDLTSEEFRRLFTRDAPEAYRFFARGFDADKLAAEPWYRRWAIHARLFFSAFTMRLSPARRLLYAFGVIATLFGMVKLFVGFAPMTVLLFPFTVSVWLPQWVPGTAWLMLGFLAANFLILMEVADRLSLKGELEIARDIQLAMLPTGLHRAGDAVVGGRTRPANTVGGDFYDILRLPDGRLVLALGDVAGKGSPAALLMALLLAMLRTLVDEGLESARLLERLNAQIARHSPASRFITLIYALYDPANGHLRYVNAGHLPPLIRRSDGRFDRLAGNGLALGMFDRATYDAQEAVINPGDVLVLFSDGITEAENPQGRAFEDTGLESVITEWATRPDATPETLGRAVFDAVERHARDGRLVDDLTILALQRSAA